MTKQVGEEGFINKIYNIDPYSQEYSLYNMK